jgi:hypothetical protein
VIDLRTGDCRAVLRGLAEASADAIVTDPPYALTSGRGKGFMGKAWDGVLPGVDVWAECLRVARPGAHLLAFGGTRTHHRLMCAIEDAGWEIRDCLMWVYGSGFPKSLDVSAAIDKAEGAEREATGERVYPGGHVQRSKEPRFNGASYNGGNIYREPPQRMESAPATDAARRWAGWGTALKPSWEIIVLARKPLDGTVAANVQAHGTGGINVDGCRVENTGPDTTSRPNCEGKTYGGNGGYMGGVGQSAPMLNPSGRFPPNFLLTHHPDCNGSCVDQCPVRALDVQAGERKSGGRPGVAYARRPSARKCYGPGLEGQTSAEYADSGPVSRFYPTFAWEADDFAPFLYCPKASRAERGEGNTHPCVKPLQLMRWLARLVCPPGGLLLDPFCGSGSTLLAADAEGFDAIGCDDDPESVAIARRRLDAARAGTPLFTS